MTKLGIGMWNRLSVRLTAVLALVTFTTVGGLSLLMVRAQQQHLLAEVVRGAALFSETIKSSTYHDMLEDRRADAYRIMETIGRQEGIERVRIFNKEGRVTFSTDRAEVGTLVDKRAESCYACHAADQPIARLTIPSRARTYTLGNHRVLGMVTPIYNEPSCHTAACHEHPESQSMLGVVDIGISLADVDAEVARVRRGTLLLSLLAVAVLAALVSLWARRLVVRPVVALVGGTNRIAAGDLDARIAVRRDDEIGRLASSFNRMATSLQQAQAELQRLMGTLEQKVADRTAALRDAQAQLVQSEKLSSLGRLAASVAHEINNPLSGILTYAKLLIRTMHKHVPDEAAREQAVRQLALIERETERCTAIVRNLLDFARQRPLDMKDVKVSTVLAEALSLVNHQIEISGITLERTFDPVPEVRADFGQLRQAFVNILLNACDAMRKGGRLVVTLRPDRLRNGLVVEISDTGPGIDPKVLSKIFDPFFTTKEKGTGLGLSVVYGIVDRHGGKLEIDSQPGRGTTVRIRLATAGVPEPAVPA